MTTLIVAGLLVAALAVAVSRMNAVSRVAAADTLGRRHAWAVHGWRVWRLVIAAALVGLAVVVATRRDPAAPAAPSTARPAAPAAAPEAAASGGFPWHIVAGVALAAAIGLLLAYAARRRADRRDLNYFLAEDDDAPTYRAGTRDTEPIDTEATHDDHAPWPDEDPADDPDDDRPRAAVHDLARRRRGPDR